MNKHEREYKEELERKGYKVLRNGWPDFLVQEPKSGKTYAVELKYGDDKLSDAQKEMHRALRKTGLKVRTQNIFPDLKGKPKKAKPPKKKSKPKAAPQKKRKRKPWLDVIETVLDSCDGRMTTRGVEAEIKSRFHRRLEGIENPHGAIGSALARARAGARPRIKCDRLPSGLWTYWTED